MRRPVLVGGAPAFPEGLPFVRPSVPPLERVMARVRPSYDKGILTNGPLVRELEERAAEYLGAPHVVAVASCTAGLMLTLQSLSVERAVVLPSFTFVASAHAVSWNGLRPVFAECDERSFQLDVCDATGCVDGAGAIMATHVFGAPCRVEEIEALGHRASVPVVFDAAHGLGATRAGRRIGTFGDAEVFSLSPTKTVVAGEGGLVATPRADVADAIRIGRDYGNPGDYDARFVGLNARMSELHAAIALESLAGLDERLEIRRGIAARYREGLRSIPGVTVQEVDALDESTYKDFTIAVDDELGVSRDAVVAGLHAEGIDTRCYFAPPVHQQQAYRDVPPRFLPVTERVAQRVVSLPIFADMGLDTVDRVVDVLMSMWVYAGDLQAGGAPLTV